MKKIISPLPPRNYSLSRLTGNFFKLTLILCFLSNTTMAQIKESRIMATCGYNTENAADETIIVYDLNTANEFQAVYGENTTHEDIGSVFGIATDNDGEVYIAAGGLYGAGANRTYRTRDNATNPTLIYKIKGSSIVDGKDWEITDLVLAGDFQTGDNKIPNPAMCGTRRAGLGNICYNARHDLLYTTNLSDGKIYRLDTDGKVIEVFDPEFDGKVYKQYYGYAPLGQRPWAIAIKYATEAVDADSKIYLYYSRWSEDYNNANSEANNEIWAVELDAASGAFLPSTERKISTISNSTTSVLTLPISDIEFNTESDRMLLTERQMKSYNSYVAREIQSEAAQELRYQNSTWKKGEKLAFDGPNLAYGATEQRLEKTNIIDLEGELTEALKPIIGDVDVQYKNWPSSEKMAGIEVYPNPTSGLVQIDYKKANARYLVFNNSGQVIMEGKLIDEQTVLDFSTRSSGIYLLTIIAEDEVYNQKINKIN